MRRFCQRNLVQRQRRRAASGAATQHDDIERRLVRQQAINARRPCPESFRNDARRALPLANASASA